MKITAVIMAGGRGERFWPKSRNNRPKQFLSLTSDGETMIQKTVKRLSPLVDAEDIFIVTNAAYIELVKEQLPNVPAENILAEPCARNTAPCIAFAAAVIGRKYNDAVMLVLPSDHLIGYENIYIKTLKRQFQSLKTEKILLLSESLRHIRKQATATSISEKNAATLTRLRSSLKSLIFQRRKNILRPENISGTAVCLFGKYRPLWLI